MKNSKKKFNLFGFLLDGFIFVLLCILTVILWLPFLILFPTKVEGRKNLKKAKQYAKGKIFAINHYSNMDGVLLHLFLFPITYTRKMLAKAELNKCKFFGRILAGIGAIYINRGKADIKAIKEVNNALINGKTLIIFPEGTRNKNNDEVQDVKSGTIFFAHRAGVPIVPAVFAKRSKIFRFNKIIIGEPYMLEDFSKEKVEQEVLVLSEKINELKK